MTAGELIDALKILPSETRILTSGYEGGFCDADFGGIQLFAENVNTLWYYGPHELVFEHKKMEGFNKFYGVSL